MLGAQSTAYRRSCVGTVVPADAFSCAVGELKVSPRGISKISVCAACTCTIHYVYSMAFDVWMGFVF